MRTLRTSRRLPLALVGVVAAVGLAALARSAIAQGFNPAFPAQPQNNTLTVQANQADVFAGPSNAYYVTTRLRYGDRITVLGESRKQPGWLEIMPPPGSFSWIDARYVRTIAGVDRIGIVDVDSKGAPVLPGSSVINREPDVEIARVATGTQVLLLERRPTTVVGVAYYPIAPVPNEVRFIPADVVRPSGGYASNPYGTPGYGTPGTTSGYGQPSSPWGSSTYPTSTSPQAPAPSGGYSGYPYPQNPSPWVASSPAGPASSGSSTNFVQYSQLADQALAAGNVERARLLYLEAKSMTNDAAWQNYLQSQLNRISPATTQPAWSPTAPTGPVPTYPASTSTPFLPTSGGVPPTTGQKKWSPWGVLRTTSFTTREGQPMFVLEDRDSRQPVLYVTTQPGLSLRDYVGQIIAVHGTMGYRNDEYVRMEFLVAEQIATPPARP